MKRDRVVVLSGLIFVSALAWAYLLHHAWGMKDMDMDMGGMGMGMGMEAGTEMVMPQARPWHVADLFTIFIMWAVMMVAMMVPTAAPMVLLFAAFNRRRREQQRPFAPTGVFLLGYLAIWTLFSLVAALAQWWLHNTALLSPMMVSTSPVLGGSLLLAAGIFQWTPLKHACLSYCRSPLDLLSTGWREGRWGAFLMGLQHGAYCVGCCWVLMSLLFVVGVMNLIWIAVIAIFVLLEKVSPAAASPWLSRAAGVLLAGWGAWMIAAAMR